MCLASRSLTNIELSFREIGVEKLVMQHWNKQSIYRYLNTVNDKVAAKRMIPCPPTILNEIASRLRTYIQTSVYLKSRLFPTTADNDALIGPILNRFVEGKQLRARWKAHTEHYFGLFMLLFYFLLATLFAFVLIIGPVYFDKTQPPGKSSERNTSKFKVGIITAIELLPLLFLLTAFSAAFTNHALFFLSLFLGWILFVIIVVLVFLTAFEQTFNQFITMISSFEGMVTLADLLSMLLFATIFLIATKRSISCQPETTAASSTSHSPAAPAVLSNPDPQKANIENSPRKELAHEDRVEKDDLLFMQGKKRISKIFARTSRSKSDGDP